MKLAHAWKTNLQGVPTELQGSVYLISRKNQTEDSAPKLCRGLRVEESRNAFAGWMEWKIIGVP